MADLVEGVMFVIKSRGLSFGGRYCYRGKTRAKYWFHKRQEDGLLTYGPVGVKEFNDFYSEEILDSPFVKNPRHKPTIELVIRRPLVPTAGEDNDSGRTEGSPDTGTGA